MKKQSNKKPSTLGFVKEFIGDMDKFAFALGIFNLVLASTASFKFTQVFLGMLGGFWFAMSLQNGTVNMMRRINREALDMLDDVMAHWKKDNDMLKHIYETVAKAERKAKRDAKKGKNAK